MKIIIRILLLLTFLVANMHETFAMQPMQWFRDAEHSIKAEDELIQATEQANKISKKCIKKLRKH